MSGNLMWSDLKQPPSRCYKCGYCGNEVASVQGWHAKRPGYSDLVAFVYVCHFCTLPTFFDSHDNQTPGVAFGHHVLHIDDKSVEDLYEEARRATSAECYTAAILCCRKLLMHIAVSKGAEQKGTFLSYVEFLSEKHYVPPDAKGWVDHIREKGNEANHEIVIMTREDAERLLLFIEMLLKIIYEFPASINQGLS